MNWLYLIPVAAILGLALTTPIQVVLGLALVIGIGLAAIWLLGKIMEPAIHVDSVNSVSPSSGSTPPRDLQVELTMLAAQYSERFWHGVPGDVARTAPTSELTAQIKRALENGEPISGWSDDADRERVHS
jgi:hypothetical protein